MTIEIKASLEVIVPDQHDSAMELVLYEQVIMRAVNEKLFGGRQAVRRVEVEVGELE